MGKERRYFRRYRRRVSFNVSYNGNTVDAVALDYSITGIGALMDKGQGLPLELDLTIQLHDEPVQMYGRVSWKKETSEGLRVGIELIGPIQGSLEIYRLSDLLVGLQRTKKDGTLDITSGSLSKKIYINNGDMIFATSNQDKDRLGDILLRDNIITYEQYAESVGKMKETGKQHGAVMVEMGLIKPRALFTALNRQVEKIIVDLFKLDTGTFHFHEGPLPDEEVIKLNLSAANLICKGIKDIKDPTMIKGFFPSSKTVLMLSPDPLDLFQDINVDVDDRSVLAYVDGKSSIENIISMSSLDELKTLQVLYMLVSANIIVDKSDLEPADYEGDIELSDEVIEEAKESLGDQTVEVPEEFIKNADELYDRLGAIGHYELLGLKEDASLGDIKKMYYKKAKDYHPDKHFHLDADMKDKLSMIFSYMTTAYSIISDPRKREAYDKEKNGPADRHVSGIVTAKDKFEQGIVEYESRNYDDAAELFGQAGYMNNDEPEYFYYYGLSLYKLDKLKEAEGAIRNALKMDSLNADYLAEIGHIYLDLGYPLRAKGSFEKALKSSPSHERAREGMRLLPGDVK